MRGEVAGYPNQQGARFDHAYHRDTHVPMVKSALGDVPNDTDIAPRLEISEVVVG